MCLFWSMTWIDIGIGCCIFVRSRNAIFGPISKRFSFCDTMGSISQVLKHSDISFGFETNLMSFYHSHNKILVRLLDRNMTNLNWLSTFDLCVQMIRFLSTARLKENPIGRKIVSCDRTITWYKVKEHTLYLFDKRILKMIQDTLMMR